jgi:hypothetical protein
MPSSVFRPSRCDLDCHLEKLRTVCQQGGTPCLWCCGLAVTDYLMSSNSIADHVFTASLLSPLSAELDTCTLQSPSARDPSTSFSRDNGRTMAVLKVISSYSANVDFSIRQVQSNEAPSFHLHSLAALLEKSRDEPPSPPPQPPPSPAGWSRPSDPDIVSMDSVSPCTTLASPATNSRKELHPHL